MLIGSLPMKSSKRLAYHLFDTFATHHHMPALFLMSLIFSCGAQNSSNIDGVFCDFQMSFVSRQGQKPGEKLLFAFYSIPHSEAGNASLLHVPFKWKLHLSRLHSHDGNCGTCGLMVRIFSITSVPPL